MKQFIISLSLTFLLSTAAFSQIQVDSIGNVGIGTVNPLVHLEVHEITPGDSIATMRIYQHNCGPICGQTTGKALQLVNSNITGVYNGARLSFADPVNVINNDEGAASIHLVNRVSAIGYGGLAFSTRNSTGFGERMRLDTAGNVGIGTVSPTQKIDINGKLRVRDVTNDNTKDSLLVVSGDGTVSYRDASTLSQKSSYTNGTATPIVRICCESWMTKNLDVDTYRNGDPIPHVTDTIAWSNLTTGAYCYYANDSATYAAVYGKLYNWYAVNDPRGLAPEGWHIPTDFEWTSLENCLGGASVAGGLMKETGTTHWNSPNTDASNLSGFTGLPGGSRNLLGTFGSVGGFGYFWSSSEVTTSSAWLRTLYYASGLILRNSGNEGNGFSVRCLRD